MELSKGIHGDSVTRDNVIPEGNGEIQRSWKFRVLAQNVKESETVCISGNCATLGNWACDKVISLVKEENSNYWSNIINIPSNIDVAYRYCITVIYKDTVQVAIRQWESNLKSRIVLKNNLVHRDEPDIFGEYDGFRKISKGWLTVESLLQLKFFGNPFLFKSQFEDCIMSVKLTPVNYQYTCEEVPSSALSEERRHLETKESNILSFISTEVATLNDANCQFKDQEPYGCVYNSGDFLIFNIRAPYKFAVSYLIDFYMKNSHNSDEIPKHFGYCYILPNVLEKSQGKLHLPIICSTKHRPVGTMVTEYFQINPMDQSLCNLETSFLSHWSESWTGLDVGHRGLGSSFKKAEGSSIRENTVASLKTAAASGADLLEFDVQLSKDLIPVIYHDFHVCIALKKKKKIEYSEMFEIPMGDLTLEQLQKLKVYHVVEGRSNEPRFFDEDLAEHQPFPLLYEVLQAIDSNVGFNIEIKWTMEHDDGTTDLEHPLDINLYIDKILEVVLKSGRNRHIVFSCFNPDVCTAVRMKQNIYPTMFLTQGVTKKWSKLMDLRCNTIQSAVHHALNADLLGIVVHTEDLLRDSTQVKLVIDAGLIIFCWGEDNNNKETIKYLKQLGLHAVIFDKLDQYSSKEVKESIFLMEANEAQKNILPTSTEKIEASGEDTILLSSSIKN